MAVLARNLDAMQMKEVLCTWSPFWEK